MCSSLHVQNLCLDIIIHNVSSNFVYESSFHFYFKFFFRNNSLLQFLFRFWLFISLLFLILFQILYITFQIFLYFSCSWKINFQIIRKKNTSQLSSHWFHIYKIQIVHLTAGTCFAKLQVIIQNRRTTISSDNFRLFNWDSAYQMSRSKQL